MNLCHMMWEHRANVVVFVRISQPLTSAVVIVHKCIFVHQLIQLIGFASGNQFIEIR